MRLVSTSELLPEDYPAFLQELKGQVRSARLQASRTVNTELIRLYWTIGRAILERQQQQGWGAKVISRLATDLRAEFPDMTGLSRSNLEYMRRFADAWQGSAFPQQAVGELPWGHISVLLDKLSDQPTRAWYAAAAVEHGWSRNVLLHQIKVETHRRVGAAASNFADRLPAPDSDLAQAMTKDPYAFDFLGLTDAASERELENALMLRLQHTLLELGPGLAFVGRQYHLEVDDEDFYVDLLFFDTNALRYVVLELKTGKFVPGYAGQLNFYITAVDAQVRRSDRHGPTIGILLCTQGSATVVQYALAGSAQPMAIATYDLLPPAERAALPSAADLAAAFEQPVSYHGRQLTLAEGLVMLQEHERNA